LLFTSAGLVPWAEVRVRQVNGLTGESITGELLLGGAL